MRDIQNEIYELFLRDEYISKHIDDRIFQDEYPEHEAITHPYLILSEIDEPIPREYGSNKYMALDYLVQIDVYVPESQNYDGYTLCRDLSYYISKILREQLNLSHSGSSQPEYDKDFKIYRRARRFEGVFYLEEYK